MARFRVLSLDGGGIRGAFAAAFLRQLEQEIGAPIGRYFDLVAGTSTGGIVAIAAALREPMHRVADLYQQDGPKIFCRRLPRRLGWRGRIVRTIVRFGNRWLVKYLGITADDIFQSRYEAAKLRESLSGIFGDKSLVDAKTRVLIPAVNLSLGCTVVFKTPHLGDANTRDWRFPIVDIALATSAAPIYFPHATITPGSAYVDGGLWANNPVLVALAEAMQIRGSLDDVQVLSIGTGRGRYSHFPQSAENGVAWWMNKLFDVTTLAQSEGAVHTARKLIGERFHRIDFDLPDNNWRLDGVELVDRLVHFGEEEAHRSIATLRTTFFDQPAPEVNWPTMTK